MVKAGQKKPSEYVVSVVQKHSTVQKFVSMTLFFHSIEYADNSGSSTYIQSPK